VKDDEILGRRNADHDLAQLAPLVMSAEAHAKAQSVQLESAGRIVPPATRIAGARESNQMQPRAVPSDWIPL
jgi:hypothetical protein